MDTRISTSKQFTAIATELENVYLIEKSVFVDRRGIFVKTFNEDAFTELGIPANFKEAVYSISNKNVLRGMHYQLPPYGHAKLVNVIEGEILDVIVGVGTGGYPGNFGKVFSTILSKENNRSLYIPEGYAHGFLCLSDIAIVSYMTTTVYNFENDSGIHYNSFGFDWGVTNPIVSDKDVELTALSKLI